MLKKKDGLVLDRIVLTDIHTYTPHKHTQFNIGGLFPYDFKIGGHGYFH